MYDVAMYDEHSACSIGLLKADMYRPELVLWPDVCKAQE